MCVIIVQILEYILETVVVRFRDRVLRCEPHVLLRLKCIVEAAVREALDGGIEVVHALSHTRTSELVHELMVSFNPWYNCKIGRAHV